MFELEFLGFIFIVIDMRLFVIYKCMIMKIIFIFIWFEYILLFDGDI